MQGFSVILIAAIAAMIAYLQWVTAHQRVVLDLFDRRKRAYENLEKSIAPTFASGNVNQDAFNDLIRAKSDCRFLFGEDINDYVKKLQADFAFVLSFTDAAIDARPLGDREGLINRKHNCLDRITSFHETAVPLFQSYMLIDLKMRYFLPSVDRGDIRGQFRELASYAKEIWVRRSRRLVSIFRRS
jgi:hypothetical protein